MTTSRAFTDKSGKKLYLITRDHYFVVPLGEHFILYDGTESGAIELPPSTGSGDIYTIKNISAFTSRLIAGTSGMIENHHEHKMYAGSNVILLDHAVNHWVIL